MMKNLLLILISVFVIVGCNARKTDKKSHEEETQKKEIVEKKDSVKTSETTLVNTDILKKLSDIGLEIQGDGKPYTLDLGGIKYEGSATIIYKDKSAESKEAIIKTIVRDSVVVTYVNEEREEEVKVIDKEKHTEKKEYQPYAIVGGLIILFSILIFVISKKVKTKLP